MIDTITNLFKSKSSPPPGEIAVTESVLYKGWTFRQYNPDTLARKKGGLKIYDKMRLDDEVKSSLSLKKYAVIAPGWDIQPAIQNDKESEEIADFVKYTFEKMNGTVTGAIKEILTALDYGYSITEIVWKIFEEGKYEGKIGIDALKTKKPHHYEFDLDDYSNIKPNGLVQILLGGPKQLPINKFILYSYRKEFGNWYGTSDLREAYRPWWSKDNIIKFWNIYLERFGSPLARGRYKTNDPTALANLKTILDNLQSKTSIAYREGDFDIDLLEAQRRSTGDYSKAIEYYDRAISRSILIPDRVKSSGEKGSYGQSKTHFDIFLWIVQTLRKDIEEIVMGEQLIRRLVNYNFQNVTEYPKLKFNPLTEDQKVGLTKAFSEAVSKGAVTSTFEDENHIRKALSFPEKEKEDIEPSQEPGQDGQKPIEPKGKAPEPGPDEDEIEDDKEKKMSLKQYRDLTVHERRVNFAQIENGLNERETKTIAGIRDILKKQRDKLTAFVQMKMVKGELTTQLISSGIDLKFLGDLKKAINELYVSEYKSGLKDARGELPKRFISGKQGIAMPPEKALSYFAAKTDFDVKGIKEPLARATHGILLNAIRSGEAVPETIQRIQNIYKPYIEDRSIIQDKKQLTSYRVEAIVRTAQSEAYNYGRRAIGEDPEVKDFVVGYQFSEIIDDRTVEVSLKADGMRIPIDHPSIDLLTYPLHWNDRGMFVFITSDVKPIEFSSEGAIAELAAMVRSTKP